MPSRVVERCGRLDRALQGRDVDRRDVLARESLGDPLGLLVTDRVEGRVAVPVHQCELFADAERGRRAVAHEQQLRRAGRRCERSLRVFGLVVRHGCVSVRDTIPVVDLRELQHLMVDTYGERDRARGVPSTVAWLTEELGELAQAVRKGDRDAQLHELGDVLAWLASLAEQLGLSLDDAAGRYAAGCPRCRHRPCSVPLLRPPNFGSIVGPWPHNRTNIRAEPESARVSSYL